MDIQIDPRVDTMLGSASACTIRSACGSIIGRKPRVRVQTKVMRSFGRAPMSVSAVATLPETAMGWEEISATCLDTEMGKRLASNTLQELELSDVSMQI